MKAHNLFIAVALFAMVAGAAFGAEPKRGGPIVNGRAVSPASPGASAAPYGSGAIVRGRSGQPATVTPFGSAVIIREPGKPPVSCSQFGSSQTCR